MRGALRGGPLKVHMGNTTNDNNKKKKKNARNNDNVCIYVYIYTHISQEATNSGGSPEGA